MLNLWFDIAFLIFTTKTSEVLGFFALRKIFLFFLFSMNFFVPQNLNTIHEYQIYFFFQKNSI